jgi:DNA-directed RNA polymerase subunit RPC12/RpoP
LRVGRRARADDIALGAGFDPHARLHLYPAPSGWGPKGRRVEVETNGLDGEKYLVHNSRNTSYSDCLSSEQLAASVQSWDGCWSEFVNLTDVDSNPRKLVNFVRTYGLLGFCEHPGPVPRYRRPYSVRSECQVCKAQLKYHMREIGDSWHQHELNRRAGMSCTVCDWHEPVAAWIQCTQQARAIMRVGASVSGGLPAQGADTGTLSDPSWGKGESIFMIEEAWHILLDFLRGWLEPAPITLVAAGKAGTAGVGLVTTTVLGNVALQLAAVITSGQKSYFCAGCSVVVERQRSPRRDELVRCEHCRRAHRADLQRGYDRRARQHGADAGE